MDKFNLAKMIHGMWLAVHAASISVHGLGLQRCTDKQQGYQDVLSHLGYRIVDGRLEMVEQVGSTEQWSSIPPESGNIWWFHRSTGRRELMIWHEETKTWNLVYDHECLARSSPDGDMFMPASVPDTPPHELEPSVPQTGELETADPVKSIKDWISILIDDFSLGDMVYRVKGRLDDPDYTGSAWDHPDVTRFGDMFTALDEFRKS